MAHSFVKALNAAFVSYPELGQPHQDPVAHPPRTRRSGCGGHIHKRPAVLGPIRRVRWLEGRHALVENAPQRYRGRSRRHQRVASRVLGRQRRNEIGIGAMARRYRRRRTAIRCSPHQRCDNRQGCHHHANHYPEPYRSVGIVNHVGISAAPRIPRRTTLISHNAVSTVRPSAAPCSAAE